MTVIPVCHHIKTHERHIEILWLWQAVNRFKKYKDLSKALQSRDMFNLHCVQGADSSDDIAERWSTQRRPLFGDMEL